MHPLKFENLVCRWSSIILSQQTPEMYDSVLWKKDCAAQWGRALQKKASIENYTWWLKRRFSWIYAGLSLLPQRVTSYLISPFNITSESNIVAVIIKKVITD